MHQKWDNMYQSGKGNHYPEPIVVRFIKLNFNASGASNVKALDIGCGYGAHTILMADNNINVHAIDVSQTAIKKLKLEIDSLGLKNVETTHTAIEDFPLPSDSFDLVLDIASLQHVDETKLIDTLQKIKQSLKIKGWFYSWFLHKSKNINDHTFSLSNLKNALSEVFDEDFKLSIDTYEYTENNGEDFIEFKIFSAQRII